MAIYPGPRQKEPIKKSISQVTSGRSLTIEFFHLLPKGQGSNQPASRCCL